MPEPLPPHVSWLLANRDIDGWATVMAAQGVHIEALEALRVLVAADPSPGAHAVQWLFDRLVSGGVRWEDVAAGGQSKAARTLGLFAQHRRALAIGSRNLEDHPGLGGLHRALQGLEPGDGLLDVAGADQVGGRALRRAQREEAYRDSIVLHNTPELIVAVPRTKDAAMWWGRGTQWCTAAEDNNMFDYYNRQGPLVVIVLPGLEDAKLQLHIDIGGGDGELQFMDIHDAPVDPDYIDRHWSRLAPIMEWLACNHPQGIGHVPPARRTGELEMRAVAAYPSAMYSIKESRRTQALCMTALESDPYAIRYVPNEYLSAEVYMDLVRQRPNLLTSIPVEYRSHEMCLVAVTGCHGLLGNVPTQHRDREMCMAAVLRDPDNLRQLPDRYRRTSFYHAVLDAGGIIKLEHVHDQHIKPELCSRAVAGRGTNLVHVPYHMMSPEMCRVAVGQNGRALVNVPKELMTQELVVLAIPTNGDAIAYLEPDLCSLKLCLAAVRQDGSALHHVPREFMTRKVLEAAVDQTPSVFLHIPEELRTSDLAFRAMLGNTWLAQQRAIERMGPGPYMQLVKHDGINLRYIPRPGVITDEMCIAAVQNNPAAVAYVPPEHMGAVEEVLGTDALKWVAWTPEVALGDLIRALEAGKPADTPEDLAPQP